ncbi:MAG: AraC family transcriptional regulator [Candidatus Kapaibacterium sp.]
MDHINQKDRKTIIYIKNMVSRLGIAMVQSKLEALNLQYTGVFLGKIELSDPVSKADLKDLTELLRPYDFHIIEDQATITVERIKALIIDQILLSEDGPKPDYTKLISNTLGRHYSHLSQIFSNHEHITIERFYIGQKLERAMELLENEELTVTEIAIRLHYSSVAHFSTQFKHITGFTPKSYRQERPQIRKGRDAAINMEKILA